MTFPGRLPENPIPQTNKPIPPSNPVNNVNPTVQEVNVKVHHVHEGANTRAHQAVDAIDSRIHKAHEAATAAIQETAGELNKISDKVADGTRKVTEKVQEDADKVKEKVKTGVHIIQKDISSWKNRHTDEIKDMERCIRYWMLCGAVSGIGTSLLVARIFATTMPELTWYEAALSGATIAGIAALLTTGTAALSGTALKIADALGGKKGGLCCCCPSCWRRGGTYHKFVASSVSSH